MAPEAASARPASSLRAKLVAQIAPGYHINDHMPTLDYLIPSELKLEPTRQVAVKEVVYPHGKLKKFAFSETPLSVYEGKLAVTAVLKVAPSAPPGSYVLKGKFTYQACNDHACLPPDSVPVALTVKVVPPGARATRPNQNVSSRLSSQ